jgi:hypothetical protein
MIADSRKVKMHVTTQLQFRVFWANYNASCRHLPPSSGSRPKTPPTARSTQQPELYNQSNTKDRFMFHLGINLDAGRKDAMRRQQAAGPAASPPCQ